MRLARMRMVKVIAFVTFPLWCIPWIVCFAMVLVWRDFNEMWDDEFSESYYGRTQQNMKYQITKTNGEAVDPSARYFVLRYDDPSKKDYKAVLAALRLYSDMALGSNPEAAKAARLCL